MMCMSLSKTLNPFFAMTSSLRFFERNAEGRACQVDWFDAGRVSHVLELCEFFLHRDSED